jgi:tetratricopeptide (TPR) repeat protein
MTDFESAQTGADTALKQALRYGANLSEVQASLGLYRRMIENDLAGSELALRRAIDINPNYAMAHLWLANTLSPQGRFREAFAELEQAEQIDPLHPAIITNIADYLFSMGRYDEGVTKLERVLELDPDLVDVYSVLTEWSGQYGHVSDGMRWARSALDENPDDTQLLLQVGALYIQLGDLGAANEYLQRARALAPNSDLVFLATCMYYFANEQYADLVQMIEARQFTSADSEVVRMSTAWHGLGRIMLGEYRRGADFLMESLGDTDTIAFSPSFDMYLLSYLAYAYQQLGQDLRAQEALDEALAVAARARGQGWRTPRLNYGIASVYALQGRKDEAIGQLRNAVDAGLRAPGLTGTDPQFEGLQGLEAFRLLVAEVDADLNRQRAAVLRDVGELTTAQLTR